MPSKKKSGTQASQASKSAQKSCKKTQKEQHRASLLPLAWLWRTFFGKICLFCCVCAAIPPLGSWAFTEWQAAGKITADVAQVRPVAVAVVLGTSPQLVGGGTNAFFEHRMDAAAELYHANKVSYLLVSGDNSDAYYNEVAAMHDALVKRNVPAAVILHDNAGLRTLDSILRAKNVFHCEQILVVSQHFHAARAITIAQHHGMDARGYAAKDVAFAAMLRAYFRETGARIKMMSDLFFTHAKPEN